LKPHREEQHMDHALPAMTDFDLVVRNAHVATAADVFDADIGVKDGAIAARRLFRELA